MTDDQRDQTNQMHSSGGARCEHGRSGFVDISSACQPQPHATVFHSKCSLLIVRSYIISCSPLSYLSAWHRLRDCTATAVRAHCRRPDAPPPSGARGPESRTAAWRRAQGRTSGVAVAIPAQSNERENSLSDTHARDFTALRSISARCWSTGDRAEALRERRAAVPWRSVHRRSFRSAAPQPSMHQQLTHVSRECTRQHSSTPLCRWFEF